MPQERQAKIVESVSKMILPNVIGEPHGRLARERAAARSVTAAVLALAPCWAFRFVACILIAIVGADTVGKFRRETRLRLHDLPGCALT